MFGMGQNKKGAKTAEWKFDLENDLKDPNVLKQTKEQVDNRVQELKGMLRTGGDKKAFDDAQVLLHGYLSVQKVIQRIGR